MSMAVPCLVCKQEIRIAYTNGIFTGDETASIMFAGDATYEQGRYNIHDRCKKPEFSHTKLTMPMIEGKVPIPGIVR